ncbi:hypothetical protein [Paenibacillus sp. PK3_47]|uniref:hypothetical protein n=1 Tax=Paenibacillus sp. PK3_47 TaxID=2072642 RepID=UPI00201E31C8|nr:hypothetical protein [Paenibacillus sp. PK3_47]
MRQSPKAWIWNAMRTSAAGSYAEASSAVKAAEGQQSAEVLKGKRGSLLPRT